ncbi:unnamed protein product [Schistocephalus solidus]|uniref:Uncharacterized protein n=1 Tax=Schistocephalus solidus TaxID=70667 RepID=A0A183TG68_SCHSO|nr:unnamed protein product [Schistocephalus solidus]
MTNTEGAREFLEAWYSCTGMLTWTSIMNVYVRESLPTVQITYKQPATQPPGIQLIHHQPSPFRTGNRSCFASPFPELTI